MDLQKMLNQARQMQSRLQEEMARLVVESSAGGGLVTARMNGKKELLSIALKPEAVDPRDLEMLQDLVVVAVNEAARKVDEELSARLGGLGGLAGLPGFL